MKTAISIPDPLFRKAEKTAKQLGYSRSRFYATAIEEFVKDRHGEKITGALNEVYHDHASSLDNAISRMQAVTVNREKW